MLTIWGRLNSHNVKKVAWAAIEMDLPHRRIDMGGPFGFTPEYLAKNPNRMIPTIEDGDLVLWESNAILRYLADRHAPSFRATIPPSAQWATSGWTGSSISPTRSAMRSWGACAKARTPAIRRSPARPKPRAR
jgi:glutathione S-transferase